jgi:carbonic anhydrase
MDIIYRYDPYGPLMTRILDTPAAAILALERGHDRFLTILTQVRSELIGDHSARQVVIPSDPLSLSFAQITGSAPLQSPFALFLGCSDARAPIEQIFDQAPNDLFVIRVAGNVLGLECLGSIHYAVNSFGKTLKLLVVLGHTTCGAVSAAVDSYMAPKDYADIAFTHALRSLVDRIQVAVRGAATALDHVCGPSITRHQDYRSALIEVSVYLNTAITAFDVHREIDRSSDDCPAVVYGVFDLVTQRVGSRPAPPGGEPIDKNPIFAPVPQNASEFATLGVLLAQSAASRWFRSPHQTLADNIA